VCGVVNCRLPEIAIALELISVTRSKSTFIPVTYANPFYIH
jgi:hypothetical protein